MKLPVTLAPVILAPVMLRMSGMVMLVPFGKVTLVLFKPDKGASNHDTMHFHFVLLMQTGGSGATASRSTASH